jgi:hypothetical protein
VLQWEETVVKETGATVGGNGSEGDRDATVGGSCSEGERGATVGGNGTEGDTSATGNSGNTPIFSCQCGNVSAIFTVENERIVTP